MYTTSEISRFRSKQVITDGDSCYGWAGSIGCNGYPQAYRSRKSQLPRKVDGHRMAWELERGQVPAGMMVLHKCGTKSCTRPDHLYLGNALQNAADARTHGASSKAVLTPRDVLDIVGMRQRGARYADIAAKFKISHQSAANVCKGRTYADITRITPRGAQL